MNKNKTFKHHHKFFAALKWPFALVMLSALYGCEGTLPRDGVAPPYDAAIQSDQHLTLSEKPDDLDADIPDIVRSSPFNISPERERVEPTINLSAINASVHSLLYELAERSGYEVDIWPGVKGNVTINAINQPISTILDRIVSQLNLSYEINNSYIRVQPDVPVWESYSIDYVNIVRSKTDTIVMNMTVGGGGTAGSQGGSISSVEVSSEHDFWETLRTSLLNLTTQVDLAQAASPVVPVDIDGEQPVAMTDQAHSVPRHESTVMINREAGLVLVYADQRTHKKVRRYLKQIKQSTQKQVLIEASVVEVALSDKYQSGIDWNFGGNPATSLGTSTGGGLTQGLANMVTYDNASDTGLVAGLVGGRISAGGRSLDVSATLKMLQEFGDVQVLSSPKIMAINNQPALLKVVENQVYFTVDVTRDTTQAGTESTFSTTVNTVPVGFMMTVTPFVNDSREVSLNIRPTISQVVGSVNDPNPDLARAGVSSSIPIIQEREMETVLRLRDQQTAIIGGLIENRNSNTRRGVPWVSSIPGIGELFQYREDEQAKTELVIFIRATIVDRPDIENGDLVQFRGLLERNTAER